MKFKDKIKLLISNGNLPEAIRELEVRVPASDPVNKTSLDMIHVALNSLERRKIDGLLTLEQSVVEMNKLVHRLFTLLNVLERKVDPGLFDTGSTIKTAFLTINPSKIQRLELGMIRRKCTQSLPNGEKTGKYKYREIYERRLQDLSSQLRDFEPDILHITGQEICFKQSNNDWRKYPIKENILQSFMRFSPRHKINLVISNLGIEQPDLLQIVKKIGMTWLIVHDKSVSKQDYLAFSEGFFRAFFAGDSIPGAFSAGLLELSTETGQHFLLLSGE